MATDKAKAAYALRRAVSRGDLLRPTVCESCHEQPNHTLVGHHWHGYALEFATDVQWLCRRCHNREHRLGVQSLLTFVQHSAIGKVGGPANASKQTHEHWVSIGRAGGTANGGKGAQTTNCKRWRVDRGLPCECGRHQ